MRAEELQQRLGDEVVAPRVHPLEDPRQRGRRDPRDLKRRARGDAFAHGPGDPDSARGERAPEEDRGGERGPADDPAVEHAFVDDEGRKRRRLLLVEPRLPARSGPARVEERLVADDRAPHDPDSTGTNLAREPDQAGPAQERVAEALEVEVSA